MRLIYRSLTKGIRHILLDKVLSRVNRKHKERTCLRNLLTDATSNEYTLQKIIDYLVENGYPQSDAARWKIGGIIEWKRQGGQIRIPNPVYLLSVQRVKTLLTYLSKCSVNVDSLISGVDFSDMEMNSQQFRKQLLLVKEKVVANNKRYDRKTTKKQLLRVPEDQNIWITWNENKPLEIPEMNKFQDDKKELFRILGLGINMEFSEDEFIGLCFEMEDTTDIILFRTGWGDATTYSYWESIKDSEANYGYTKPIDRGDSERQPEAVSENKNFHIERISSSSFSLK